MFATGETVGLAEWIIDDTCLVISTFPGVICKRMYLCVLQMFHSFSMETFSSKIAKEVKLLLFNLEANLSINGIQIRFG